VVKKAYNAIDPERSKSARRAKHKGSRAQREVAKLLSIFFYKDEEHFHSTPASGGLRWSKAVAQTRGDIVCTDDKFPYSIEIKNQEKGGWDLLSLLLNEGPIYHKWWKQCAEDAEAVNKYPWLIFTRNQIPFMTIIRWFDGHYLRGVDVTRSFRMGDLYITSLAHLLFYHSRQSEIVEMRNINPKIIDRHLINPLKRIGFEELL